MVQLRRKLTIGRAAITVTDVAVVAGLVGLQTAVATGRRYRRKLTTERRITAIQGAKVTITTEAVHGRRQTAIEPITGFYRATEAVVRAQGVIGLEPTAADRVAGAWLASIRGAVNAIDAQRVVGGVDTTDRRIATIVCTPSTVITGLGWVLADAAYTPVLRAQVAVDTVGVDATLRVGLVDRHYPEFGGVRAGAVIITDDDLDHPGSTLAGVGRVDPSGVRADRDAIQGPEDTQQIGHIWVMGRHLKAKG
jgi:hypothetical protein